MNSYRLITMSFKNIRMNRKRTGLTILGIVIGIASVITILSIGEAYKNNTIKQISGDYGDEIKLSITLVPDFEDNVGIEAFNSNDINLVNQISGVKSVKLESDIDGISKYTSISILGEKFNGNIEPINSGYYNIIKGRNITKQDNINKSRCITLSKSILENTEDIPIDMVIGQVAVINGITFEIIGIVDDSEEYYSDIYIPTNTYNEFLSDIKGNQILKVTLNKGAEIEIVTRQIEEVLNRVGSNKDLGSYYIQNSIESIQLIKSIVNSLTWFTVVVAAISLFVSAIGVMNMIFTSVSERKKEIGIKRAIGAKKSDIINEFLIEGCIITMIGGGIGYVIGILNAIIVGMIVKIQVIPSVFTVCIALTISIVVGILSSIIPAKRAAEINTIDLLY